MKKRMIQVIKMIVIIGLSMHCETQSKQNAFWIPDSSDARDHFFFTKPQKYISPEEKSKARDMVLHFIQKAKSSIDIWCYSMNEQNIIKEIAKAKQRGITIRIVGSFDQNYDKLIEAGIVPDIRNTQSIQHIKLIIVDKEILISGTGNFTKSGFFYNQNSFFYIRINTSEYEKIITGLQTNGKKAQPIHIARWGVQIIFSPGDGRYIQHKIISSIKKAKFNLNYLIFSHTDPVIASALISKSRQNVTINGIYDDMNNDNIMDKTSQGYAINESLGLSFSKIYLEGNRNVYVEKIDGNTIQYGGHLHHKTLIVDNKQVLTGSYNWSLAARDSNLEMFFIINNEQVAQLFNIEFESIKSNSLLLSRPPILEEQINPPTIDYNLISNELCIQNKTTNERIYTALIRRGAGIFESRQIYIFKPGVDCITKPNKHVSSSGILQTDFYNLESLSKQNISYAVMPGNEISSNQENLEICINANECIVIEIESFDTSTGILWLKNELSDSTTTRIWTNGGLTKAFRMIELSPGVYQIPDDIYFTQDIVFFFTNADQKSETKTACIQTGSALPSNIKNFKRFLLQESGKVLPCYKM